MSEQLLILTLESALTLTLFYLFYRKFFYKIAHFEWSRLYFMLIGLTAIVLPIVSIPINLGFTEALSPILVQPDWQQSGNLQLLYPEPVQQSQGIPNRYFTLSNVLMVIYVSGIARHLYDFLQKMGAIRRLNHNFLPVIDGKLKLHYTEGQVAAFSFFNHIYLGKHYTSLSEADKTLVIEHEKIHANQSHSSDILTYELLHALFWFNPLMPLIKNALREIHEYIADTIAVKHTHTADYSRLILSLSSKNAVLGLANNFSKNHVKNRILMLHMPEPTTLRKFRFIIALPLLFVLTGMFSLASGVVGSHVNKNTFSSSVYSSPVGGEYYIISPFFLKQTITRQKEGQPKRQFVISHPELTIQAGNFAEIFAISQGLVTMVERVDNWGVMEYGIEITHNDSLKTRMTGLYRLSVAEGDAINKGGKIGYSGDVSLYPTIGFQVLLKNKPTNPEKLYE